MARRLLALGVESRPVAAPVLTDADLFIATAAASVEPVDTAQLSTARRAHLEYGRGSGSPANLDYGDCFAYALAVTSGEPLLFKGYDFAPTDVLPAA